MGTLTAGDRYTRFARHGRLYKLFLSLGDEEAARRHLDRCLALVPAESEVAELWRRILGKDKEQGGGLSA